MAKFTEASVLSELQSRRYPSILETSEFSQVVAAALRDLDRYCSVEVLARINTLTEIQDYYVFNPNDEAPPTGYPMPTANTSTDEGTKYVVPAPIEQPDGTVITYTGTKGPLANAYDLISVDWNPGGDFSSLNVFSPGWQLLSQTIIYSGSYFNNPAMMMVLNQKLNAFKKQFGDQGFQLFGQLGDPLAFIRINPVPLESNSPVVIKFLQTNSLETITSRRLFNWFMMWMEYRYAEALANFFAQTAGVSILGFADSTAAMKFFERRADKKRQEAVDAMGGLHGEVDRS